MRNDHVFRIMVVDDDPDDQELFSAAIDSCEISAEFDIAGNGQEALHLLKNTSYDGIFLDINMPVMNGYEFLKKIKQDESLKNTPPVFVFSTATHDGQFEKFRSLGAEKLISKPSSFKALQEIVQEICRRYFGKKG